MRRALHGKSFLFFGYKGGVRGEGPRDLITKTFPQLSREAAKGLSQPQSVIIFFTAKGVISLTFMYTQMPNRFQHFFFLIQKLWDTSINTSQNHSLSYSYLGEEGIVWSC